MENWKKTKLIFQNQNESSDGKFSNSLWFKFGLSLELFRDMLIKEG